MCPWFTLLVLAPLLGEVLSGSSPLLRICNPGATILITILYGGGALLFFAVLDFGLARTGAVGGKPMAGMQLVGLAAIALAWALVREARRRVGGQRARASLTAPARSPAA